MAPVPLLTLKVGWGLRIATSMSPGAVPALQAVKWWHLQPSPALQGHKHLSRVPENKCLQARACGTLFSTLPLLRGDS